jgi:hypothetical protein
VATLDHPVVGRYRTMTKPVKFSDTPGPAPVASATFGQHSDEVLAAHGYSAADIASLRERGIVRRGAGSEGSGNAALSSRRAMAAFGVRREKAAPSSGCEAHPAIRSRRKQSEQSWR